MWNNKDSFDERAHFARQTTLTEGMPAMQPIVTGKGLDNCSVPL